MDVIYLGGNSAKNESWVKELRQKTKDLFNQSLVQEYRHWQIKEKMIDFDHEAKALHGLTKLLREYVIIAKSAGTGVTLKAIDECQISPKKVFFLGTPIKWAKENGENLKKRFRKTTIEIICIQNTKDPYGSFKFLKKEIGSLQNINLIEMPRDSHDYTDFQKLKEIISKSINN